MNSRMEVQRKCLLIAAMNREADVGQCHAFSVQILSQEMIMYITFKQLHLSKGSMQFSIINGLIRKVVKVIAL